MAANRIVSLVPSWTETLFAFGAGERLVGRTDFCIEPAGEVERVPALGGTKNPDLPRLFAARPDLVVVNREENTRGDVEAIERAGVPIVLTFARTVREALAEMGALARAIGADREAASVIAAAEVAVAVAEAERAASGRSRRPRVFCPIWRDSDAVWWMTLNGDTYVADLLRLVGLANVFEDRDRRYPLGADLGERPPAEAPGRDVRYPRVTPGEIVAQDPDLVLLPSEPYAFGPRDADAIRALVPRARVVFIDGKDLSWHGARIAGGLPRVTEAVRTESLAPRRGRC